MLPYGLRITFPQDDWGYHEFADDQGRVWVHTKKHEWIIAPEYAWDGASFALNFESTIPASAFHDSAGQFRHQPCIRESLDGGVWNLRFAEIIEAQGSPWVARLYWFGLTLGNPLYVAAGKLLGIKITGRCLIHT